MRDPDQETAASRRIIHRGIADATEPRLVLLVDPDPVDCAWLAAQFQREGFHVLPAARLSEARERLLAQTPALIVSEGRLPDGTGLGLLCELRAMLPEIPLVILTRAGSVAEATDAIRRGAAAYLTKPAVAAEILADLRREAPTPRARPEVLSLARAEWEYVNRVLVACDGNKSEAARRLGIRRTTLQRKLGKYPPAK